MKRKLPLLFIPIALLVAVALAYQGESPAKVAEVESPDEAPTKAAGMMLYIDPDTGEFVEPSPGAFPIDVAYDDAYSTDDWGLLQEPAPKGGGAMMNLQGRFMNTFTVTVDDGGNLSSSCNLQGDAEKTDSEKEGE